jgi:L-lactate permease
VANNVSIASRFVVRGDENLLEFAELSSHALPQSELIDIGAKTALLQSISALIIPVVSLRFVVGWGAIWRNLGFIYLSILSCVVPVLAVAWTNYEFPAVIGGVLGLSATILLARFGIGLEPRETATLRQAPLLSGPVLVPPSGSVREGRHGQVYVVFKICVGFCWK